MNAERCLLAGEALGLGYAALNRATRYAKERVVFGNPIGKYQSIQHGLAEAYMNLEAAKLATFHAARLYDRAAKGEVEVVDQKKVGAACNAAKYLAGEACWEACERAVSGCFFLYNGYPLFLISGCLRLPLVFEYYTSYVGETTSMDVQELVCLYERAIIFLSWIPAAAAAFFLSVLCYPELTSTSLTKTMFRS